jgi:hypothetical protein
MPPVPVPSLDSTAKMTDIAYGECIPLSRDITVCYNNATQFSATLSVSCSCGGAVSPSSMFIHGWQNGCTPFTVTHAMAGNGHTITATLIQFTALGTPVLLSSDEVGVNVGNPCPIITDPMFAYERGIVQLDRNKPVSGKYDKMKGNGVILLLEEPAKLEDGKIKRSRLLFADPAEIVEPGVWKHIKIPNAKTGHHLRIVLTKDGEVISIIRGVYTE